jgi:uncharacterized membrane protein YfcA
MGTSVGMAAGSLSERRDVDLAVAGLLALGFFFGASIGAIVATKIEGHIFLVSLHMMLGRHGR